MGNAYDRVTLARKVTRPNPYAYISHMIDGFVEFHGDRYFGDDKAVVGGIGLFRGKPVTVIGIQKGNNVKENIARNFGSPMPEGYRKALRLMKQADKFGRPIITLINTSGAFCGSEAEERGQAEAIARNLKEMFTLRVPVIAVIIGEGGSGGALALAVADRVWMLKNSVYSILSPEGFASILWKDSEKSAEAAELMKITADDLLELKVIDKIIDEPEDGVDTDFVKTADNLAEALAEALRELGQLDTDTLLQQRYQRFRKYI